MQSGGSFSLPGRFAQEFFDFADQAIKVDRFGFEVVAADVQSAIPVFAQRIGGERDNWNVARLSAFF